MCEIDEDEAQQAEFWSLVAVRVLGLMVAEFIAYPDFRKLMEAVNG